LSLHVLVSSVEHTAENVILIQKMQYSCDIQCEKQMDSTKTGSNLCLFCKKLPFVMPLHSLHSFILSDKAEFCTLVSYTTKKSTDEGYWTTIYLTCGHNVRVLNGKNIMTGYSFSQRWAHYRILFPY
jgi:hypothetical protein